MAADNAGEPDAKKPAQSSPFVERLKRWDNNFSVFKGLGLVTVAASLAGGYLQYLNTYEQKVGELAQADMTAATAAFVEISNAYAEIQMLQQLIYFNYVAANNSSDAGNKAMTTKAGQDAYQSYVNARNALRRDSNIYVRKAELYIDWPSNLSRDAAGTTALDGDPLTETCSVITISTATPRSILPITTIPNPTKAPRISAPPRTRRRSRRTSGRRPCSAPSTTTARSITRSPRARSTGTAPSTI